MKPFTSTLGGDGTVEGTDKIQRDGDIYTFTANIYAKGIGVERSHIVIDGKGYIFEGPLNYDGFDLHNVSNVTIVRMDIRTTGGIQIDSSNHNNISENNIPSINGIDLSNSSFNSICRNNITDGNIRLWWQCNHNFIYGNYIVGSVGISDSYNNTLYENIIDNGGLSARASNLTGYLHSIDISNLVDGKPVYYLVNQTNLIVNDVSHPQVGWLALVNCKNMTVEGLTLEETNSEGLLLAFTNNSRIANNHIRNNPWSGIHLVSSHSNSVTENTVVEVGPADSWCGISLSASSNNIFSNNNITSAHVCVFLDYNAYSSSSSNMFYHNFIMISGAGYGALYGDLTSMNAWDNGVEGNFWLDADFSGYGEPDQNMDGICELTYSKNENNTDHYPLKGIFQSFRTSLGYDVDIISNSTIEDFEFFPSNSTIRFYVSRKFPDPREEIGFCRVCIPRALMNGSDISVIIDNGLKPVLYPNYTLYDNGTHRWIYLAYGYSTHRIDVVPEFPSFLILATFMIATLLAILVYKRKRVDRR